MDIDAKALGFDELTKYIRGIGRKQIPFASAIALTRTAQRTKKNIQGTMKQVFDEPTRYTLGGIYVYRATKKRLIAEVGIADWYRRHAFIEPEVYGGPRPLKNFEKELQRVGALPRGWFAVPGESAKLNKFGNMSQGLIVKILSDLKALRGVPTLNGQRASHRRLKQYFPVGLNHPTLPPGVYKRLKRGIRPMLIFVKGAPVYEKRLPFNEVAMKTINRHFPAEFYKAFEHAMRTAK